VTVIEGGLVNAHTHLYSGLAALGLPPLDPPPTGFPEILARRWWVLDRALDARLLRASARHYVAHAALAGTTTIVDHHESPGFVEGSLDVLAEACAHVGVRAVLTYGATERNGGVDEARRGLDECERFARAPKPPTLRAMVGLHASFTVSDDTVREAGRRCRALGLPLHVHVAEDRCDVEDARQRGHAGPLERLIELGALVPGSILAHGVHLDEAQVERAIAMGAWLVQNPRSNEGNGVGFAARLGAHPRVALGTDGFPSDLLAEGRALDELAVRHDAPAGGSSRRLEAGRALAVSLFGAEAIARDRVELDERGRVRTVVVEGREVVRAGELVTADLAAIEAEALEASRELSRRMREVPS
jgi:cytosine/adenosine deaminase-related metal-dependent hydrolase